MFGTLDGQVVESFVLAGDQVRVELSAYGATIANLETLDRDGRFGSIVTGWDALEGYLDAGNPYFGCVVGRFGNRIAHGRFTLGGKEYRLDCNDNGLHHLHGGNHGFSRRVWEAHSSETPEGPQVEFTLHSPDGDGGYPGALDASVTYRLEGDTLVLHYRVTVDAPTIANLTNHAYFNLAGSTSPDALDHEVQIHADHYVPVDDTAIPYGSISPVEGTAFDLREPTPIRKPVGALGGIDHTYVVRGKPGAQLRPCAEVLEPITGRRMSIQTTEPGVQFYTGNFLDGSLTGRDGARYSKHWAFCLETQHFPDSPNQPSFPSVVLRPDHPYTSTTTLRFTAEPA